MFSSGSFMVSGHTFVFNPLQVNYYGVIYFIIFHVNIKSLSKPFIEETIFSPLNIRGSFFKYYWLYMHGFIPGLRILFHRCLFL